MVVVADRWKRHRYDLWVSRIPLHPLLHVVIAVLRYLEVPSRRLVLRHRLFAPLELVHAWAAEAVAPALPSLLFLGFRPAFFCLLPAALVLFPAGALVLLPAGAMVLILPVGVLVLLLPVGVLVLLLTVAVLLPEDFLVVPEAEAAAGPPLLVAPALVEGPV